MAGRQDPPEYFPSADSSRLTKAFIGFPGGIVERRVLALRGIVFVSARSFFSLERLADLELERRLFSRSRDLDGQDGSRALALEERIDRFPEERFDPGGGLRDFSLEAKCSMKIESLAEQPKRTLELHGGSGDAEREAGKRHLTVRKHKMPLHVEPRILEIVVPRFPLASPAQAGDFRLHLRVGKPGGLNTET